MFRSVNTTSEDLLRARTGREILELDMQATERSRNPKPLNPKPLNPSLNYEDGCFDLDRSLFCEGRPNLRLMDFALATDGGAGNGSYSAFHAGYRLRVKVFGVQGLN